MNRPAACLLFFAALAFTPVAGAACQAGDFDEWIEKVKRDAAAQGVGDRALGALDSVEFDDSVIAADRAQQVFAQNFLEFSGRMADSYRLPQGKQKLKKHADVFRRIEKEFGVPGPVIVAFWALETDFGAFMGNYKTLQSLATLGYDCRRPEMFREELMAALKILDRGDLSAAEMKGAWAGELGQMQFQPTGYLKLAVDYDGDGKRNLVKSVPDVLASSAALLKSHGWRANEPWLEEVRVPEKMDWAQADLAIKHPRSKWKEWGVKQADGGALSGDGMQASLLLPMGRKGPAFLAYPNFSVYTEWNKSLVYATTAAYLGTRLAGAPKVRRGDPPTLSHGQVKDLQRRLEKMGYDVGKVDGTIGAKTRAAVRDLQKKHGLPADSWPTEELLEAM